MEPTQSNETKQKKKTKKEQGKTAEPKKATRKDIQEKKAQNKQPIRRIFPIWLRIVVVFILAFLALIIGLVVGYSVLGDGEPMEVLKMDTWRHILDIVTGGS